MIVVMQMNMVEVEISDARRYTQVVALVDRNDFLDDICSIRERLQITSYPYVVGKYADVEANNLAQAYKKGLMTISEFCLALKELCLEKNLVFADLDKKLAMVNIYAESMVNKYRRERTFVPVVIAVILTNLIYDDDFRSTSILSLDDATVKQIARDLEDSAIKNKRIMTIQVSRESTVDEVKRTLLFIKRYYFHVSKGDGDDELTQIYDENHSTTDYPDTISNIIRDRAWYWMHQSGMGYKSIWKASKDNRTDNWQGVKIAIDRYARHLNT